MGINEQLFKIALTLNDSEDIAKKYAKHLKELFDVIDNNKIGKDFSDALKTENYQNAVSLLACYYRKKPDFKVRELSANGSCDINKADKATNGIMCEVNLEWTFTNGKIDFLFDPTLIKKPRNHEWLWQFNRHSYWKDMARAYRQTSNEKYAIAFRNQFLDWIAQTDIPEDWNGPGSAWRTIECGLRLLGSWQVAYDGFKKSESVEDATLLLMIASMHRQSVHLVSHPTKKNWLMMESNGVYTFSALFNELIDSENNRKIATERLLYELENQILPDGMHNELSPDYQTVVYNCAANFYSLAQNLGMENEIPENFIRLMKKTTNAAIMLSTPAFIQPKTNDTFTLKTSTFTKRSEELFGKNPEYTFVNTNRADGEAPKGETASKFLSYAGFAVMRSSWDEDALYMCFDIGPLGVGHMHQDKLNIIVYKGNEELIHDDGGGQYDISPARVYSLSGYGHNTILVDSLAQNRKTPLQVDQAIDANWVTNEVFDYASSIYDDAFGENFIKPATHKREVRFCKPDFFCVTDTLTSVDNNSHDYEILFHLDTTKVSTLSEYKNSVISDFGRKYEVVMIPLDEDDKLPDLKTVSGATEPQFQGWYNGRNESNLHEAITVSRIVKNVKNYRFTTLIFPIEENQKLPEIKKDGENIKVYFNNKEHEFNLSKLNK